jgi:hypothetical protein
MADDERKSRLHIHLGGLIILIIIFLILFKVDIKSKIQSPQFQENITYIEDQSINIWTNYILNPIKSKMGDAFINATNQGIKQLQDNFTKNVLKIDPTTNAEIDNTQN